MIRPDGWILVRLCFNLDIQISRAASHCFSWACVSSFSFEYMSNFLNIWVIFWIYKQWSFIYLNLSVAFYCLKENYLILYRDLCMYVGFPQWLIGKEFVCNAGVARIADSIPGLGRFSGWRHCNLLQILAWRILWTEQPGRLWSPGSQSWTLLKLFSIHARIYVRICLFIYLKLLMRISSYFYIKLIILNSTSYFVL